MRSAHTASRVLFSTIVCRSSVMAFVFSSIDAFSLLFWRNIMMQANIGKPQFEINVVIKFRTSSIFSESPPLPLFSITLTRLLYQDPPARYNTCRTDHRLRRCAFRTSSAGLPGPRNYSRNNMRIARPRFCHPGSR